MIEGNVTPKPENAFIDTLFGVKVLVRVELHEYEEWKQGILAPPVKHEAIWSDYNLLHTYMSNAKYYQSTYLDDKYVHLPSAMYAGQDRSVNTAFQIVKAIAARVWPIDHVSIIVTELTTTSFRLK